MEKYLGQIISLIGEEVISYTAVGTNQLSGTISRGVDNTFTRTYAVGDPIQKYELSGVSLRKINTEHSLADVSNNITGKITLDDYHVRITGDNLFNRDKHGGGDAGSLFLSKKSNILTKKTLNKPPR